MIALCKAIKEVPILIVVPKSQSLLEQTYLRFLRHFGEKKVGYNYGKGTKLGRIMITSPGSAEKLNLNKFQAILGDEIHHAPSLTYKNIFLKAKNAIIRYGFSGIPIGRSDLKDLETVGLTGIITSKIDYQELQEKGFLANAEYYFVKFNSEELLDNLIWIHSDTNDWHTIVDNYFLWNETRREIITELTKQALQKNRNILIIVERKRHGELLKNRILFSRMK